MSADQSAMDEPVTVTLPRRSWLVIVSAASDFDARVPGTQGDGGACLDVIRAAIDIDRAFVAGGHGWSADEYGSVDNEPPAAFDEKGRDQ